MTTMTAIEAQATTDRPADTLMIVASIVKRTGDYAGSRIHLRTCANDCGSLPGGWRETRTGMRLDKAPNRANTVIAPCAE